MQDKAALGTRYTCYQCEKKFYDLNRPEPICPGCGADQRDDPTPDPRVAVMARYKGSRLTTEQTQPSKEQFKVEEDDATADDATVDGEAPAMEDLTVDAEDDNSDAKPAAETGDSA